MLLVIQIYNIMILNNGDALTFRDKYTALLQQELQNLYWCLHDPITTKSYQISSEMDIETMPHAMYFSGNDETIAKINHVPYQVIEYDDKGMFQAKINGQHTGRNIYQQWNYAIYSSIECIQQIPNIAEVS